MPPFYMSMNMLVVTVLHLKRVIVFIETTVGINEKVNKTSYAQKNNENLSISNNFIKTIIQLFYKQATRTLAKKTVGNMETSDHEQHVGHKYTFYWKILFLISIFIVFLMLMTKDNSKDEVNAKEMSRKIIIFGTR